jgi:hypothetical protein
MTNTMAPTIPLAIVLFAGVVALVLRAAAGRPDHRGCQAPNPRRPR